MQFTLFISNISEDVWPFIDSMSAKLKKKEIKENVFLGDLHFMAGAGEKNLIFIGPEKVDESLKKYYCDLFEVKDVYTFTPRNHSGNTTTDLINDKELFEKLVQLLKKASKVNLVAYSSTKTFYALGDALTRRKIKVNYPESPKKGSIWTVDFFGSKSGIRQMGQPMPPGYICSDIEEAIEIAANMYLEEGGVVIKTNKGHAGMGILIYRKNDLPKDYDKCTKVIGEALHKEDYWKKFQIIVENYIDPNIEVGGGFPNVEFKIDEDGKINFLYACGNRVTKEGVFSGIEIGRGVMDGKNPAEMKKVGMALGSKYKAAGYKGYFDVDFVYGKDGKLYINESNARRTGGTHVYRILTKLLGSGFSKKYILSKNMHQTKVGAKNFDDLLNKYESVLYNKKKKEGVIFCSSNLLKIGLSAYIIVASGKESATAIETKLHALDK